MHTYFITSNGVVDIGEVPAAALESKSDTPPVNDAQNKEKNQSIDNSGSNNVSVDNVDDGTKGATQAALKISNASVLSSESNEFRSKSRACQIF